jgi:hypothetical protein
MSHTTLSCPYCNKLLDTLAARKIGHELFQCRRCGKVCRSGLTEWAHLSTMQKWSYWLEGIGVAVLLGVGAVAIVTHETPVHPRSILIVIGLTLFLIAATAIFKFVVIALSLRRCPTSKHPPTLRSQAPRWILWCGISLTGSPLACLALERLMEYSIVPLLVTIPLCVIGVYLWQIASLRGVVKRDPTPTN